MQSTLTQLKRPASQSDAKRVAHELNEMCLALRPGDKIPTHTELMRRFRASERSVRNALDHMQRSGRIIRRTGSGTFVADPVLTGVPETMDSSVTTSRTVVAITQPDNSFFNLGMDLLHRQAEAMDLTLVCRFVDFESQSRFVAPSGIHSPLGYIFFRYDLAPLAHRLQQGGTRVVMIGAPHIDDKPTFPCVHGDHEQGAYLATSHLIELGHRKIAFAMPGADYLPSLRWLGHQQAIDEAKHVSAEIEATVLQTSTVEQWSQNPQLATEFFQQPNAPTGLTVWNDHEAAKLLAVLSSAGLRVPHDVSLVGYDNLPEGRLVYPQLTTIDQSIGQQLQVALRLLMRPTLAPAQVVLTVPQLLHRGSSAHFSSLDERTNS